MTTSITTRVRRENLPIATKIVDLVLQLVSNVPTIVVPTGSTVFNGEGNDFDFAIFCGAAPRCPGDSILPGARSSLGRAMIAAKFKECGYTEGAEYYAGKYEGGADIRSFRKDSINVILYTHPDEWNAMKKAHEACVAAAAVSPLTRRQRAGIFMAVRDGWEAATIANYFKVKGLEDYI